MNFNAEIEIIRKELDNREKPLYERNHKNLEEILPCMKNMLLENHGTPFHSAWRKDDAPGVLQNLLKGADSHALKALKALNALNALDALGMTPFEHIDACSVVTRAWVQLSWACDPFGKMWKVDWQSLLSILQDAQDASDASYASDAFRMNPYAKSFCPGSKY